MATTTSNLKLTLPAVNDAADIEVLNNNFKLLDALGGYGLGRTASKLIAENAKLSDQVTGGMYHWTGGNTDPDKPFNAGELLVIPRAGAGYLDQIAFGKDSTVPEVKIRQCMNVGSWSAWADWSPSAFAPSGYGLGTSATYIIDLNNAKENGFYYWNTAAVNAPFISAHGGGEMIVLKRNENTAHQIAYDATMVNSKCVRQYSGGTWGEWEWVNPPMQLGVEYRTTERWNGAAVYTKLVDCGEMPSNGQKEITFAAETTAAAFDLYGRAVRGGELIRIPYGVSSVTVSGNKNRIVIRTDSDFSSWYGYVCVKYTK